MYDSYARELKEFKQKPLKCGMWTLDCVRDFVENGNSSGIPMLGARGRDPLAAKFKDGLIPPPPKWGGLFPALGGGALGSCAVVAVGDNLLDRPFRGREIDAHDTVWRYNSPVNKFRPQVGMYIYMRKVNS
jgi:hypothetical protein